MAISTYFDSRFKFGVHMVQLALVLVVIILSVVRVSMAPPQRAHIMGIAIGAKSIVFISYQLLTEHCVRFRKWASPKANFILNCLELPFWGVVMYLLFAANIHSCTGGACGVSWAMAVLAIVLLIITHWVAIATYFEYRYSRTKAADDTIQV
ncbi:hypothetical protein F4818DRAFT_446285 [Hypoxylon cercidicola]|nr:hypothetical protein F4818DRAFT_446285 [Hypoxylon cercidicola]